MKQFTIRRLLSVVTIIAIALAAHRSNVTYATRFEGAVGVFGSTFEHKGRHYDCEQAHAEILALLCSQDRYESIDEPAWGRDCRISGQPRTGSTGWQPARSDGLLAKKGALRNYIHIASAQDGFSIDVWSRKGMMLHERRPLDESIWAEAKYASELVLELQQVWMNWCKQDGHQKLP